MVDWLISELVNYNKLSVLTPLDMKLIRLSSICCVHDHLEKLFNLSEDENLTGQVCVL